MHKKLFFYRLSLLIIVLLSISMYIILTDKLNTDRQTINLLERQIAEHQASEKEANSYGDYQGNDEFSTIIDANPIDPDYQRELQELQERDVTTTLEWWAFEEKYRTQWSAEVHATFEYLYQSLDEADRINLERSQQSWQAYMDADMNFVEDRFIATRYFGTQGDVKLSAVQLHRTRQRAIELMEYVFSIDRTAINFVYEP